MRTSRAIVLASILAMSTAAAAQQKPDVPKPTEPQETAARTEATKVPLKVTVVISRHQGDKRLSSLPYTLGVTTATKQTSLRMGIDVPTTVTVFGGGDKAAIPQKSYQYRSVGTNIDCTATAMPGGIYSLSLTVSDNSVHIDRESSTAAAGVPDVPSFRKFESSFTVLLRDGQTMQHTSATDPVSGEVMRIDVTLNVLK